MAVNDFIVSLIAGLSKTKSKQQIKSDIKSLGDMYVKLIGNLDMPKTRKAIKAQLKGLNNLTFNITPNVNTKGVQSATKQAINNAQRVANSNKVHLNFDTSKQQLVNQIKILGKNNNKLFNDREMVAKYNQLLNSANVAKSASELKTLRGELSAFKTELVVTNNAGMTWGSKFKESIKSYAKFFSGASFIYAISNQVRNAATEAKSLDDSLVDLQKVTDEITDRDALYKYFDKSLSKAQELNVKVGSLIDAVTEFKKLGWDLDDAELGAKWATILENVGDVDIDTAIGSIKTSIASFDEIGGYGNDQMDKKLEAYTDLVNEMSNKYSIDAEGLAEAIRISAGILTQAHTSIEQAATMFATANRFYNDPNYLGNTAKIGSLRLRASEDADAKQELKNLGEDIDDVSQSASKLQEKLLKLTGVDIMEADGKTFKSFYDQLYEISQVMDNLSDTDRANVLETIFGKSRAAGGAALLSGMKESVDAYNTAINSAGSATEEYQTWMTSADAACQKFSNTLTETYQSIINGNTVRDLANLGSAVLQFANNFGIIEGTLKGIIAINIGKLLTTGIMSVVTATKQIEQYGKALQMASNVPNGNLATKFQTLKSIAQATSSLTTEQLRNVLATKALSQADRIRILQLQGMTKEMALQKLAEMNLTQATNAQTAANTASTVSTFSLKAAITGLGTTIKSVFLNNPAGVVLMGLSVGISAMTTVISKHNQEVEESRQKAKEAADTANTLGDEITELTNKYIQLSEAVKTDSSSKEELMTVQEELIKKLGIEGQSIDDLIKKYGSLDNALKNITLQELGNQENDLIAGVKAAEEELKSIGKGYEHWYSLTDRNLLSSGGKNAVKAYKVLEKAGLITTNAYGTGGGAFVLTGDDNTIDGILENYQKLEDAMNALRKSGQFTDKELGNNSVFNQIYNRAKEMEEFVNGYNDAITNLNKNVAQQQTMSLLQGKELPKTKEGFKKFKQELIDASVASKKFIGTEKEITDTINNYLLTVPQFEEFYNSEAFEKAYTNTINRFKNNITEDQTKQLKVARQNLEDEYKKIFDWGLNDYADQIKNNTIQSKFGNVDMDKRTIIHWSDELKQTYADALASWDYDPEVGSIDTVFGGSQRFGEDLDGTGWEVAFTPILPDGTFLSKDTVEEYINSILAEAYADDGKITEDELTKIDAQGRKVGDIFVKGIFAGIDDSQNYDNNGNWAEVIGRLMHFAGKDGAVQIAKDEIAELEKDGSQKIADFFNTEGINTQDQIDAFNEITKGINDADLAIQKWNEHKKDTTSFADAWSALDNVDSDSPYKDTKKDLMELADAGQLTAEKLKTVSGAEEYFKKIEISAKDAADEINKLSDESTQLASMADQVAKMSDTLATKADKGVVDYSTLSGFDAEVKNLDSWDKFQSLLGSSKSSMEECQAAANALATEWVNSNNFLANLNETNKDYYITQLDLMGVENAEAVVTENLTVKKMAQKAAVDELDWANQNNVTSTMATISSLLEESDATDSTRAALVNLIAQETIFNNSSLDVSGKIDALNQLALAAYGVSNALNSGMGLDNRYYNGKTAEERAIEKWNIMNGANSAVTAPIKISPNGSHNYKSDSKDKGAKDKAEKTVKQFYSVFDWMEKKIKYLERITEKAIERISDSLQYAMDKSYISNTFKKINEQMATNAYMVQRYKKSADAVGLADEDLKNKIKNGGNIDYYKDHNMHDDFGHVYDEDLNNKITAYADWIDKSLEAAEANETLKKSVKELAETISQAPIDKAANKIEKYDSSTELVEAKVENYKTAKNKNKQLDIKASNIDKTLSSYKTAYNTTKSNEKSYEKKITKQKVAKGATDKQKSKFKSLMAKVKSAAKGKKKISDKTLESIYSYCASVKDFTWYQNAVTYNSSIEAMDSAKQTYDLYKQTSKKDKREIAKEKFDNVVTEYDNKIGLIDNGITDIDNKLALTEAKGMLVNANYYKQQKAIKAEEQSYYQQELQRLQELANGIEKGTQEWYDAQSSIQDCKNSISECTKAQLEYNNAINEADVAKYEKISSLISRTSTEMEFLEKLMSHDKMYDDNGAFTDSGIATLGTYAMSYYDNLQNANRDKAELDRLKGMLASGDLGTYNSVEQLQQRIDELYDTWQDDISATYSAQESIFDMMSDKFNAELDALQELVERRRESLELSKEIFEYQNKISEKTKSINTLQKQIAAYKGDTSQEGRAKLQKLQVSLQDAQKDLRDTEYDKYISDQEKLLDKLLDEFKENIEKRLEDFKKVVNDGLTLANANSTNILKKLQDVSSENEYTMQFSSAKDTTLKGYVDTIVAAINSRTTTATDNPDANNGRNNTSSNPTVTKTSEELAREAAEKAKREAAAKVEAEKRMVSEYKDRAVAFIKENGKKTSKEPSDAVNKVIYKKYGKKYLPTALLKQLATILDVPYDNAKKGGRLYQRLKELGVSGFKHGGIGRLVKSKGEDGLAMVRNGEGLVAPEHVKSVQELLDLTPLITDMIKVNQPDYTKLASMVSPVPSNIGDVQFNFELNECENAQDIIKQIQTDAKIQHALRSVTTDQMLGFKRSNTNRIK